MTTLTMESPGDSDWFTVTLTAGKTYDFDVTGLDNNASVTIFQSGAFDSSTELFGAAGAGGTSLYNYTADASGTYKVRVVNPTGAAGAYSLSVGVVPDTYTIAAATPLSATGVAKSVALESPGDTDWFKLSLTAGTTYTVTESGLSPFAQLAFLPDGSQSDFPSLFTIESFGVAPQKATYTADATGTYWLAVSDDTSAAAPYTVSLAVVPDSYTLANVASHVLTVGTVFNASMESAGDTDWFQVSLTAGTTYAVTESGLGVGAALAIQPASHNVDTYTQIFSLSTTGSPVVANLTADATGTYYVTVHDDSGDTGAYTVKAVSVNNAYTLAAIATHTLTVGTVLSASMQSAGDTDWFQVSLTAGVTYTLDENGLSSGATISTRPAGASVKDASVEVSGSTDSGAEVQGTYTPDTTGTYDMSVFDDSGLTAGYNLDVFTVLDSYTLAAVASHTLSVGAAFDASMESPGDTDWFQVSLTAGTTYTFTADGLQQALMQVEASGAAQDLPLEFVPSTGDTSSAKMTFTADSTGSYDIGVYDPTGYVGDYTMTAQVVPDTHTLATPASLTVGAEVELRNDFNLNGYSDILLENTNGAVVIGQVVSGQAAYAQVGGLGPEWKFVGTGDFYGDGHAEFLIENTSGAIDTGEQLAPGQLTYAQVAALGPEWSFKGVGDFYGDGKSDFLIENTVGAVVTGEVANGQAIYTQVGALGPEWKFVGVGDFLGDGKDDFLIENTLGAVVVGEVVNGQAVYTQVGGLGPEWSFRGTGDFLGDGKSDFLIESTTGAVVVGEVVSGAAQYTQVTALGPEWHFVGAGDFLGEGHDQFLIENTVGAVDVGDWYSGQMHFTQVGGLGPEWTFHL